MSETNQKQVPNQEDKNWLIRTKHRQILGPVSKKKIIEFVEKGSLGPDDEISRGNGYWFTISEKSLLDKYVFGDVPQEFNPIAEAKTVLASEDATGQTASFNPSDPKDYILEEQKQKETLDQENLENFKLPENNDLDYPDLDNSKEQDEENQDQNKTSEPITQVFDASQLANLKSRDSEEGEASKSIDPPDVDPAANEAMGVLPDNEDLAYPDIQPNNDSSESLVSEEVSAPEDSILEEDELDHLELSFDDTEHRKTSKKKPNLDTASSIQSDSVENLEERPARPVLEEATLNDDKKEKKSRKRAPKSVKKQSKIIASDRPEVKKEKTKNDRYLFLLLGLVIFVIIGVLYFYGKALNRSFIPFISSAYSQTVTTQIAPQLQDKKKTFVRSLSMKTVGFS